MSKKEIVCGAVSLLAANKSFGRGDPGLSLIVQYKRPRQAQRRVRVSRFCGNRLLKVLADKDIEIVWIDERLHFLGVELMAARADKDYTLCDAVSFCVMRERSLTEGLTTDKHFEQEGFVRMLR